MSEAVAAFHREMESKGLGCSSPIIADGEIHRFDVDGDKSNSKAGWYIAYEDEYPTITFGSWKTGEQFTWSLKNPQDCSPEERQRHKARRAKAKEERERLRLELATPAQDRQNQRLFLCLRSKQSGIFSWNSPLARAPQRA